jgi:hypothetical protein
MTVSNKGCFCVKDVTIEGKLDDIHVFLDALTAS